MLSPGRYHELVPTNLAGNLLFRRSLAKQANDNPIVQEQIERICEQDCIFWINTFAWQYNPNAFGDLLKFGPFITWDFQNDAVRGMLEAIVNRHDFVIEKSRELGASWLCLLALLWVWRFHGGDFILMSKDEKSVDRINNPNALFPKMAYVLDNLPPWMLPEGWVARKHRQKLLIYNPENRGSITGEASTASVARGGRATAMFCDEFGDVENDKDVRATTANTTDCRIINSTHAGLHKEFYTFTRDGTPKVVMHWLQHPEKRKGAYRWWPKEEFDRRPRGVVNEIGKVSRWEPAIGIEILDPGFDYESLPNFQFVQKRKPLGGPFPGIRSPWYDAKCKAINSDRRTASELDIDPISSTALIFDPMKIAALVKEHCREPDWQGDVTVEKARVKSLDRKPGGPLKLWTTLRPNGKPVLGTYGGGSDVSAGLGATPSTLSIANAQTGEKVLEYAFAHIEPVPFADLCVALCWLFQDEKGNGALFGFDAGGTAGERFLRRVLETGYRRLYYPWDEKMTVKVRSNRPGINLTSRGSKKKMCEEYDWALGQGFFVNRSRQAMEECLLFNFRTPDEIVHSGSVKEDDPAQAGVNHGDRVIADAICWKMMKELFGEQALTPIAEKPIEPAFGSFWHRVREWERHQGQEMELDEAMWAG